MIIKPCIICNAPCSVPDEAEIVVCNHPMCIITVENSIGLHQTIYTDNSGRTAKVGDHYLHIQKDGSIQLAGRTISHNF